DAQDPPFTYEASMMQDRDLRYGENPHQEGALYGTPWRFFDKVHGKDLSYNNLLDTSNALALIDEFRDAGPTCAILKHTNPCGVATANTLEAAWQQAFATDTQSPYGGIVVVNQALDRPTAEAIDQIFTEIIIAPDFEPGVLDRLTEREGRRIVRHEAAHRDSDRPDVRSVLGGLLVQTPDPALPPAADLHDRWDVPTVRAPTDDERSDLDFAWRVAKHVKSNAIVYAKDRATLGIGAGQMSRIDASELAVFKAQKSELDLSGSVVASDAFFPFADGLVAAANEGVRAAIQPGGSIRDDDVIEAADERDVTMILTGRRHFRH
ncbi:MAG: bifunctional phosphoribosylaminoimidazolecarboxamide formyltransferase/inosine monophosphate cyclohydrolase, partial [Bacteroidetes bacterium QH_2_64_26]